MNTLEYYQDMLKLWEHSNNTINAYVRLLTDMYSFIEEKFSLSPKVDDVDKITGHMLTQYFFSHENWKGTTKNLYTIIIKGYFHFLHGVPYIKNDPSTVLRLVRIKEDEEAKKARFYDLEDVNRLFECAWQGGKNKYRNSTMIALLLGTGLRVSEMCGLNLGDIRHMIGNKIYCVRKGGDRKAVAVMDFALEYLVDYIAMFEDYPDDHPLFSSTHGNRMTRTNAWSEITKIQQKARVAQGVHTLRHVVLTYISQGGMAGIEDARIIADHKSIQTTQRYTHAPDERINAVVQNVPWNTQIKRGETSWPKQ